MLNIHAIERNGSRTLGPGLRYVLWLQGCPFNCKGCVTPQARPVEANKIYTVESVAKDIVQSGCDGLTISGGEPFLQAEGLSRLLHIVKVARPEMSVIVFTGFLKENLQNENAMNVLKYTDLLIDGPYVESLNDGVGLRGSSNQRFHFLTDMLKRYEQDFITGTRAIEITFNNNTIESVGIPLSNNLIKSI